MSSNRNERARRIVAASREIAPSELGPFLDGACLGDAELRREVESLLLAEDSSTIEPDTELRPPAASGPLDRVGRYRLLAEIGRGGMGHGRRLRGRAGDSGPAQGGSEAHQAGGCWRRFRNVHDFLPVHNLESLESLARHLESLDSM